MECTFKVGDRVVCVDDSPASDGGTSIVKKGDVYTIKKVWMNYHGPAVRLQEVSLRYGYVGFHARRFRPVVERGTEKGMSILRDILNKTDKPARVEA